MSNDAWAPKPVPEFVREKLYQNDGSPAKEGAETLSPCPYCKPLTNGKQMLNLISENGGSSQLRCLRCGLPQAMRSAEVKGGEAARAKLAEQRERETGRRR